MGEREENYHERLKQKLSELEQEWTAMKTSKSSSAVSWITVEEALTFVENSPRELMLSIQDNHAWPKAKMMKQIRRSPPFRRKLFQDSDDDDEENKAASFSHSSCWSSNGVRVRDSDRKKKEEKKSGKIVIVGMVLFLLLVLVVLMHDFDHLSMNTQIDTLVPT